MRAGNLRYFVEIQQNTQSQDSAGALVDSWVSFASVWAAVWPVSAKEHIAGNVEQMTVTHRVKIRFLPGVKANMRILFSSRVFDIVSIINPDERGEQLDLLCKEIV